MFTQDSNELILRAVVLDIQLNPPSDRARAEKAKLSRNTIAGGRRPRHKRAIEQARLADLHEVVERMGAIHLEDWHRAILQGSQDLAAMLNNHLIDTTRDSIELADRIVQLKYGPTLKR